MTWSGTVSGRVSALYNNDFQVIGHSINSGGTIDYQYDNDGLLTQAGNLALARDPQNGLLTGTGLGNITTNISYTPFAEAVAYTANYNDAMRYAAIYVNDRAGRITTKSETVESEAETFTYVYDQAGRLKQVKEDDLIIEENTYDDNGNRTQVVRDGETITAAYDEQDRMLSFGDNSYTYTDNGDLTAKTNSEGTTTYQYDMLGNLISVDLSDGDHIEYIIDGLNRRIGKKVNGTYVQGFLYQNSLKPAAELDNQNRIVSKFIYGEKINIPSQMIKVDPDTLQETTYRIISDHLGSPRLIINAETGEIAQQMDFDTWGRVIQDTNPGFQPFGFAGGLYDRNTDLVRFGLRDYDIETGRWTTKDPILFEGGDTNLYGYCLNDPVNYIDPSGEIAFVPILLAFACGFVMDVAIQMLLEGKSLGCVNWGQAALSGAVGAAGFGTVKLLGRIGRLGRYSRASKGVPQNANFAQKTFGNMFSKAGKFRGKSVDDVAAALRKGKLNPSDMPIDYIVRDGKTLILNTRSAQALTRAGIPRSQWNAINRTGQSAYEARLTDQLTRNKLTNEGISTVRPSGVR